jgi:hypothetical protein
MTASTKETVLVVVKGTIVSAKLEQRYPDGDCRVMYQGKMILAREQGKPAPKQAPSFGRR